MKSRLDQNLSPKLASMLHDSYPGSAHVMSYGLSQATDQAVWEFARQHDYTLVTKDSDFHELSLLRGSPPKIVWLRHGNCTTQKIGEILRRHGANIRTLRSDGEAHALLLF